MSLTVISPKSQAIANLNDNLRRTFKGGRVMVSAAFDTLPEIVKSVALTAARNFNDFTPENDPYGEHDCALFTVGVERFAFKIDYYDLKVEYASENPADPYVTTRVLTISLASDL